MRSDGPAALPGVVAAARGADPFSDVSEVSASTSPDLLARLRAALDLGALAVMAMVGASLLLSSVEHLHERRRALAALGALRRATAPGGLRSE